MKNKELTSWTHDTQDKSIDFERLCHIKKSTIKRLKSLNTDNEGRFIISARKSYIDLADYNKNPERYKNDLEALIHDMKDIVTDSRYKDMYVQFCFSESEKIHNMTQIHFVMNMIMWKPLFALGIPVDKSKVFMPKTFTNKAYVSFVNEKIIEPYKHLTTHNEMSRLLAEMYDDMVHVCELTGIFLGLSFSLYDIIKKWDEIPELDEIAHTKIDKDMKLNEVEEFLKSQTKRYKELCLNDINDNMLKPLFRSGQGVNEKQGRELLVHQGYKPSLSGHTIPMTNDSNLVTSGYDNLVSYTLDALGGRKASVLSLKISDGGYFKTMCTKLTGNIFLHNDPEYDCGSQNYYELEIKNKNDLDDMRGRWYKTKNGNVLNQLLETDYHLIGETLYFRTPAKCASKNGVCKTCYGHLYNQNYMINIGINSSLKLSEKNLIDRLAG